MEEIRERLKKVKESYGKSYALLALKLNDTEDRLKGMLTGRQRIADDVLHNVVLQLNVSAHWLLTGKGEMYQSKPQTTEVESTFPVAVPISHQEALIKNHRKAKLSAFIEYWFATKSMDEQAWLEVQLRLSLPQYADFVDNKEIEAKLREGQAGKSESLQ